MFACNKCNTGKIFPFHIIKAHKGSSGIALLILNLIAR